MRGPASRWCAVGLLLLIGGLNYADRAAIASIYPLLRSDLKMSDVDLAAVGAFFLWAYAPASLFGGMLADRFSRRWIIVGSAGLFSAITLAMGFVATSRGLLIARTLLGVAEAPYVPAAIALLADHFDSRIRATAIGLYAAGSAVGVIAGGTGLAYLGERFGWRFGFVSLGAIGLVLTVAAALFLEEGAAEAKPRGAALPARPGGAFDLLSFPTVLVILGAMLVVAIGNQLFLNWLPLYFRETFAMTLIGAGFTGTFMVQAPTIAGSLFGGILSDRLARGEPRRRFRVQIACAVVAAPFLLTFFLHHPDRGLLDGSIVLFSFVMVVGSTNAMPLVCDLLPPRLRSTAVGVGNALNCLSGGAGVMVAGFLKSSRGLAGVFGGISGLTLLAAAILFAGYAFFLNRDLARNPAPG